MLSLTDTLFPRPSCGCEDQQRKPVTSSCAGVALRCLALRGSQQGEALSNTGTLSSLSSLPAVGNHLSAGRHRADRVALPWQSSPGKPRGVELTKRRCSLAFLQEAGWLGPGTQMGSDGPSNGLCPGGRDPERRRLSCGEVRAPASLQEASELPALDQKDPKVSGSSS